MTRLKWRQKQVAGPEGVTLFQAVQPNAWLNTGQT
jgi:hypothetical protein